MREEKRKGVREKVEGREKKISEKKAKERKG